MSERDKRVKAFEKLMRSGLSSTDVFCLKTQLMAMGFFTAPASTKYHGNYEGGLFDHSFTVTSCYTKYGMTRTGCVGCPFNRKLLDELSIIEEHEPKMLKAVSHVFKDSYEYTRMFREYVQKRKNEEKERTK